MPVPEIRRHSHRALSVTGHCQPSHNWLQSPTARTPAGSRCIQAPTPRPAGPRSGRARGCGRHPAGATQALCGTHTVQASISHRRQPVAPAVRHLLLSGLVDVLNELRLDHRYLVRLFPTSPVAGTAPVQHNRASHREAEFESVQRPSAVRPAGSWTVETGEPARRPLVLLCTTEKRGKPIRSCRTR
jgi:hypothetical protein